MKKALLVIDVQNDYFPGGKLPLWNIEETLTNIETAIRSAKSKGIPVILIQQFTDAATAPFFNEGTLGAEIHPRIQAAATGATVIAKRFADSFHQTGLDQFLSQQNIKTLLVCGMMTQNCVTHTAISKSAEKYKVILLSDCCTTLSELVHKLALRAISTRLLVVPFNEALR